MFYLILRLQFQAMHWDKLKRCHPGDCSDPYKRPGDSLQGIQEGWHNYMWKAKIKMCTLHKNVKMETSYKTVTLIIWIHW